MNKSIIGNINSIQSLGTLDGPGIRCILFMQGCPLRCKYCHNPETWSFDIDKQITVEEAYNQIAKYKMYFGKKGGVTISGGEALMQSEFVLSVFKKCKENGIKTALDTSGCKLDDTVKEMLKYCDLCLLDIKALDEKSYVDICGGSFKKTIEFLNCLEDSKIDIWIRYVVVPDYNDKKEYIIKLKELTDKYNYIKKIELLPFKNICSVKYDNLNINFPFKDKIATSQNLINELTLYL